MTLGAGRATKDDVIDYKAGITLYKKPGDKVRRGDVIARLYTDREYAISEAEETVLGAIGYTDNEPSRGAMIYDVIK